MTKKKKKGKDNPTYGRGNRKAATGQVGQLIHSVYLKIATGPYQRRCVIWRVTPCQFALRGAIESAVNLVPSL